MDKLLKFLQSIKLEIMHNKAVFGVVIFALTLIIPLGASTVKKEKPQEPNETKQVLGAEVTPKATPTSTPTPTPTPTPRRIFPTATPTTTPTPTSAPSANSSSNSNSTITTPTSTPTPTSLPTPTATPTSTPTPTPIPDQITIKAGFDTWITTLISGETAFDAIKRAVGDGLTYDQYECCGAFITGFHGEKAVYPQWWEFFVNGVSSSVGVSSYIPSNDDVLEFVYHE